MPPAFKSPLTFPLLIQFITFPVVSVISSSSETSVRISSGSMVWGLVMISLITPSSSITAWKSFSMIWFSLSSMEFKSRISDVIAEKLVLNEFCAAKIRELKMDVWFLTVFFIPSRTWAASWYTFCCASLIFCSTVSLSMVFWMLPKSKSPGGVGQPSAHPASKGFRVGVGRKEGAVSSAPGEGDAAGVCTGWLSPSPEEESLSAPALSSCPSFSPEGGSLSAPAL